jgi:SNF family Na+-dependent transporter
LRSVSASSGSLETGVFGSFNPRLRGVGVASVACGWMLVVYYSVLIAWVINAFFDSFGDSAPWADEGVNGDIAITHFLEEIIGTSNNNNIELVY